MTNYVDPKKISIALNQEQDETNLKVLRGAETRDMTASIGNKFEVTGSIRKKGVLKGQRTVFELEYIENLEVTSLSVRGNKIYSLLVNHFTTNNNEENIGNLSLEARFSLEDYAKGTKTKEELSKMTDRQIQNFIKNERKAVNKELSILYGLSFSTLKGNRDKNKYDYEDVRIISRKGIREGYVLVEFTPQFAKYLISQQFGYFDKRSLQIAGNDPNTYKLQDLLVDRWNYIDAKTKKKIPTHNRLTVKNILSKLSLPTYESVKKIDASWYERIKTPLENSLNKLVDLGIIESYNYGKPNNELLKDEEYNNIDKYEDWKNLLIYFKRSTEN